MVASRQPTPGGPRRVFAALLITVLPAVAASDEPLTVASDPTAQYFVLERRASSKEVRLLLRRVTATGVSYSQPDFDCQYHTVGNFVSVESLDAIRRWKAYVKAVPVSPGSVAGDLWIEACDRGRTPEEKRAQAKWEELEADSRNNRRIQQSRPYRRERPLRSENVSDSEVREIQSAASALFPGAIVNIGSVVSGCPCEDGSSCSAQVWIVAYRPEKSTGVLLSRIGRQWTVGPVQKWWLDYEARQASGRRLSVKDEEALNEKFPTCAGTPPASGEQAAGLPSG